MLWIPRYHMFKWLDTVYHSHKICTYLAQVYTFGDLGSTLHLPFIYFSSCSLAQICYDDIIRISYISYVHNSKTYHMHTISSIFSPNIRMPICSTRIGMYLFTNRCMIVELLPASFISRSSWFIQHLCDSSSCSCNQHTKTYDAKAYLLMDDEGSYTAILYVLLYSHTVQTRQRFICKT